MDMNMFGQFGALTAAVLMSAIATAKETTLTVTDGVKWSTGTWSNGQPVSGDTVILRNQTGAAAVVDNDLLADPAEIVAEGNAEMTLKGLALSLCGGRTGYKNVKTAVSNGVPFTVDVPIAFVQNNSLVYHGETLTFNGDITIADNLILYVYRYWCNSANARNLYFNGSITGLNASYGHCTVDENQVYFRKPVKVKKLYTPSDGQGHLHFQSAGNSFESYALTGGQTFWEVANATTPPVPVSWPNFSDGSGRGAHWLVADQTFDGLVGPDNPWRVWGSYYYRSMNVMSRGNPVTLTLKNTKNCGGAMRLGGSREDGTKYYELSLVYDPTGDFTQSFSNRVHELNGSITVKGGTLLFAKYVEFPNLKEIDVMAGTFDLAYTNETVVLPSVKRLSVASNATFRIGADCPSAVSPISLPSAILYVDKDARLEIDNGVTVPFYLVFVDGACVAPGQELTEANTTWIKGSGKITTASNVIRWKGAVDGNWHDATKWTTPPQVGQAAYALSCGAPGYEIALDPAQASAVPSLLTVSGSAGVTSTVALTRGAALQGWNVSVESDGAFTTAAAALTNNTIALDGGTFRVTGDTEYAGTSASTPLTVGANGTLEVADGTLLFTDLAGKTDMGYAPVNFQSGSRMNVSGSACVKFRSAAANSYKSSPKWYGTIDISGNACLDGWYIHLYASDATTTELTLRDHATLKLRDNAMLQLGNENSSGFCRVNLETDGQTIVPYSGIIAISQSSELNIRGGHFLQGNGNHWRIGQAQNRTGVVNVEKGCLKQYASAQYDRHLYGINVGDASGAKVASQTFTAYGYLNVFADGVVSNITSGTGPTQGTYLRIGTGNAVGAFNLLGGEYYHNSRYQAYVGGFAGTGTWLLESNAVARLNCDVYVGGCVTNDLCGFREFGQSPWGASYGNGGPGFADYFDQASHTAKGTLTVESGRFLCCSNLYTSVDGTGKLAFGGDPDGFLCARNVTLSNTTDTVGAVIRTSSLTFSAGPTGVARLVAGTYGKDEVPVANGTLTIAAGTTLRVNFSKLTDTSKTCFPLIQYAEREGSFASIEVVNAPEGASRNGQVVEKMVRGVKGYYYCVPRGMFLLVR